MDNVRRLALIREAQRQGIDVRNMPPPLVSLEAFFTGNDDPGSIGCNTDHPGPEYFREPLFAIRSRPGVQDVRVEINDIEEPDEEDEEDDEPEWPFSERIYIFTSSSREEVADWLASLQPDSVEEGFTFGVPEAAPRLQPGMKVYSAWWD